MSPFTSKGDYYKVNAKLWLTSSGQLQIKIQVVYVYTHFIWHCFIHVHFSNWMACQRIDVYKSVIQRCHLGQLFSTYFIQSLQRATLVSTCASRSWITTGSCFQRNKKEANQSRHGTDFVLISRHSTYINGYILLDIVRTTLAILQSVFVNLTV